MFKKHESGAWITDTDTGKDILITYSSYDVPGWKEVIYEEDALAYAEEQARKARREALEEALKLVEIFDDGGEGWAGHAERELRRDDRRQIDDAIRALMDTRRDGE